MLRVAEDFHATHTGRQRRTNEDAFYARTPLFAIADGMGGAQAGEIAAGIAVEALGGGVPGGPDGVEQRLAGVIVEANDRIHAVSREDERRAGMGTTMTALFVGDEEVTIAHVGDSRAYRWRGGELERLTVDHTLVEELVRRGKLTPEEAGEHPQRSVITRALGPEPGVQVDTQTCPARDGDVYLLCSDGLTSMVGEERIAAVLGEAESLERAGRTLIDDANDAGGRDNITVVLVRLEDVDGPGMRSAAAEQPTTVGSDAPRTEDVRAAVATAERPRSETRRLRPVAPPPPAPAERRRRRAWVVAGIVALVIAPIGLGAVIAINAVYFVGSDEQGFVTIYRGLPYELPFGIELYEPNYASPVRREQVPAGRRDSFLGHELRSRDDAYEVVRDLERGRIADR